MISLLHQRRSCTHYFKAHVCMSKTTSDFLLIDLILALVPRRTGWRVARGGRSCGCSSAASSSSASSPPWSRSSWSSSSTNKVGHRHSCCSSARQFFAPVRLHHLHLLQPSLKQQSTTAGLPLGGEAADAAHRRRVQCTFRRVVCCYAMRINTTHLVLLTLPLSVQVDAHRPWLMSVVHRFPFTFCPGPA